MNDQMPSPCHLCGGPLESMLDYPVAGQVTSDCRPWLSRSLLTACQTCGSVQKSLTPHWHVEVAEIYSGYAAYMQAEGGEQRSFDAGSGANQSRSQTIVKWLRRKANLPKTGTLLDIGCGNGSFLKAFRETYPDWQMIGAELDERNRTVVEAIPGVIKLHTGPLEKLSKRFDLIVMIHALEHIPGPREFLVNLADLQKPTGSLLIEVPDLQTSPFDILITDHCTHFSKKTLRWAVESAGHRVSSLVDDCVAKELTLLANGTHQKCMETSQPKSLPEDFVYASNHLGWLHLLLEQAMSIRGRVGIFGSSISSTWLAAALGDRATFFVDEDSNRIGKNHLGRSILSIEQAPLDLPILMPIRRDIAQAVKNRLGTIHPNMITPPENCN